MANSINISEESKKICAKLGYGMEYDESQVPGPKLYELGGVNISINSKKENNNK